MASRGRTPTLAAMTLAGSMILVDQTAVPLASSHVVADLGGTMDDAQWILTANILPLAAFMVVGGQLGDRFGLKRVFLLGATVFAVSTAGAGASVDMPMLIACRAVQGVGAALMMPTSVALVSAVYPPGRRGSALGVLAGGTAFFAALGPVLGGLLTGVSWRLVFLVNVPLALAAITLTVLFTPRQPPEPGARRIDVPGIVTFAVGIAGLVYGLGSVSTLGLADPQVAGSLAAGVLALVAFVVIERRVAAPMVEFALLRRRNLLAANISQFLAGSVELGVGFMLPYFYLLAIGISPEAAGIALLPATIPIILAGPLAGRAFDRLGPRIPLVAGFLVLAASGVALAAGVSGLSVWTLVPGLLLQGAGLGIVLTVNDPTGLNAVPERAQGQAAGMLNTAEQLGGAVGIAGLLAFELSWYRNRIFDALASQGVDVTEQEISEFRRFLGQAEQQGLDRTPSDSAVVRTALQDSIAARVDGYEAMFLVVAVIALLGALVAGVLVRGDDDSGHRPRVFGRRSRWVLATAGRSAAVTRVPPEVAGRSG